MPPLKAKYETFALQELKKSLSLVPHLIFYCYLCGKYIKQKYKWKI